MKTLKQYLKKYYQYQKNIVLVSRPNNKTWWGDRCLYLEPGKYETTKHYNHRSVLYNEVIIEFDDENKKLNKEVTEEVIKRLKKDKIKYMLWDTTNKSYHVHFLINIKEANYLSTLKRAVINYYTKGLPIKADLRVVSDNHLIRAEYGIHENTGNHKVLLRKSNNYFIPNELPQEIWEDYVVKTTTRIKKETTTALHQLTECSCIDYITNAEKFRTADDGRERAMFMLIHILKKKYDKEELKRFLIDWYKYTGGYKITRSQIENKVNYHWNRDYTFGRKYLEELLEDIGKSDVMKECPIHGGIK